MMRKAVGDTRKARHAVPASNLSSALTGLIRPCTAGVRSSGNAPSVPMLTAVWVDSAAIAWPSVAAGRSILV